MTPEIKRYIQMEIRKQMRVITSGAAGTTTMTSEDIQSLMPGMPTIPARPIMHPFGFASRAPQGLISVTAQVGEHPGNKMTLGHRDKSAPALLEGESVSYSAGGYRVAVKNGEIFVGKESGGLEHMVVGETLKAMLISLITAINAHTHEFQYLPGPGPTPVPGTTDPPMNAADFTQIQTDNLDSDKILAKDGGRY